MLQSLDGRSIRVDEAGKGGRQRGGGFQSNRGGRFGGSRGRGGRGYSRGETQLVVMWNLFLYVILIFPCFSFAASVLLLEAVDTAAIGATVTGVMVTETSEVAIGAMVAAVDTELVVVEEDTLTTERIGRS